MATKKIKIIIGMISLCMSIESFSQSPQLTELPFDSTSKKVTLTQVNSAQKLSAAEIRLKVANWANIKNMEASKTLSSMVNSQQVGKSKNDLPAYVILSPMLSNDTTRLTFSVTMNQVITLVSLSKNNSISSESATLTVFIKDGKYKTVVTDFVHQKVEEAPSPGDRLGGMRIGSVFKSNYSGGAATVAYENEDVKRLIKRISADEWKKIRLTGLTNIQLMLSSLSAYILENDEMNF